MHPPSRFESTLAAAATVLTSMTAMATPSLEVEVAGDCPSVGQVKQQLSAVMPELVEGTEGTGEAALLSVEDRGETYGVTILETSREFVEPSRDCAERARVVSVVAALALEPVNIAQEPKRETPSTLPEGNDSAPSLAMWLGAEVSAVPQASPGVGPVVHVRGASDYLVLDALGGFRSGMRSEYEDASIVVYTLPFALSALVRHFGDGYTAGAGVGVAIDVISVRGRGVPAPETGTRAAVGAMVSAFVSVPLESNFGAFANVSASYFPRPYELEIAGRGRVGETATVWAGFSAGLTYDLR